MKKLLAFAVAILMAAPAFAAVQNVKVSGDIDSTYINRQHFGLGQKATSGIENVGLVDQSVFITQTRLRVDADLSDNVSTTVGLINEHAWNAENTTNQNLDTEVDLYLAYVTLREFLYSPLTVTVGRQIFHYGNGLVMGDGGQNNIATGNLAGIAADLTKRTTYDGIKAVLDYKPLTIDLIYFKNNAGVVTGSPNANKDDSDVYGLNANYQLGDSMNTVVEGYIFARVSGDKNTSVNGATADKGDQLYVPGLRVSATPIKGLNAQAEVAWQGGRKGSTVTAGPGTPPVGNDNVRREAMAYQFMASYAIEGANLEKYKPVVSASYTLVSGDKNGDINRPTGGVPSSGETYSAWDPFNEAQGSGTIYNSLLDLTNMQIVNVGLTASPMQDVTAGFSWTGLWAAQEYSGQNALVLRQPDRTATFSPSTSGDKHLGNEYDVNLNYAYTEDVSLGVSLGWFVPGDAFASSNDSAASQALAHVLVNF